MKLNTSSAILSFYIKLEEEIAKFYEDLATKEDLGKVRENLLFFAKENRRIVEQVQRTYREVITDAFESGFSFTDLNEKDYLIKVKLREDLSLTDALQNAIDSEEMIYKLCVDASESSRLLLPDFSQAFELVAKRKIRRKKELRNLLPE